MPEPKLSDVSEEKKPPAEPETTPEQQHTGPPSAADEQTTPKLKIPPWFELLQLNKSNPTDDDIKKLVYKQIQDDIEGSQIANDYNLLFVYDSTQLGRSDTDKIYRGATAGDPTKPFLLILDTPGGNISSAYFIAKICREYSAERFEVAVPRRAKSAGTLICCGADLIHMGSLSELGPIDPQFQGIPALALKHSIEHLAELVKMFPAASDMFATYLSKSLRVEALGYYERVAVSATHYAARLLINRRNIQQPEDEITLIANKLVYAYKDHAFVIDAKEATDIFGSDVIKYNSPEYKFSDKLYKSLDMLEWVLTKYYNSNFSFTGSLTDGCVITKRPTN